MSCVELRCSYKTKMKQQNASKFLFGFVIITTDNKGASVFATQYNLAV